MGIFYEVSELISLQEFRFKVTVLGNWLTSSPAPLRRRRHTHKQGGGGEVQIEIWKQTAAPLRAIKYSHASFNAKFWPTFGGVVAEQRRTSHSDYSLSHLSPFPGETEREGGRRASCAAGNI